MKLRDASQSVGWLNTEGPLSTTPTLPADTGRDIVSSAVRSHGRDAALPHEFVDALTAGIDGAIGCYKTALEAILALDLKKTSTGGDDFYSGPDRFFQAWLIAYKALGYVVPSGPTASPKDPRDGH